MNIMADLFYKVFGMGIIFGAGGMALFVLMIMGIIKLIDKLGERKIN